MTRRLCSGQRARAQRGLSLVTALLFMVAALILGVSVVGINAMQERMIGSTRDRELAMQAAEAALRDAERFVSVNGPTSVFTDQCTNGLCTRPSQRTPPSPLPAHEQEGFSWATVGRVYGTATDPPGLAIPKVAEQPRYVIEKLGSMGVPPGQSAVQSSGPNLNGYRITAWATGARKDTVVILQSVYAR